MATCRGFVRAGGGHGRRDIDDRSLDGPAVLARAHRRLGGDAAWPGRRRGATAWIASATMALAALALVMFVTMLCDPPTRRAIDSFNRHEDAGPGGAPWRRRSFSANYGDRRLMIVNRLAALALLMVALMGRQDLAVLCFVSVAISALMLMLMLKRRRNGPFRDGGWRHRDLRSGEDQGDHQHGQHPDGGGD